MLEEFDFKESFAKALKLSDRRIKLCKNTPDCPSCGEHFQMQLIDYTEVPAIWKCRKCKHEFGYENIN